MFVSTVSIKRSINKINKSYHWTDAPLRKAVLFPLLSLDGEVAAKGSVMDGRVTDLSK